jgi:hypothetical protein
MWRGRWVEVAKICAYVLGVGNVVLLVLGEPTTLILGVEVVLAPFTLAVALKLTVFLACSAVSLVLGDRRERVELLVCAIGVLQPPSAGKGYREAMIAEIRAARSHQVRAIGTNLVATAPKTILEAWVRIFRPLRKRARNAVGPSTERSAS